MESSPPSPPMVHHLSSLSSDYPRHSTHEKLHALRSCKPARETSRAPLTHAAATTAPRTIPEFWDGLSRLVAVTTTSCRQHNEYSPPLFW